MEEKKCVKIPEGTCCAYCCGDCGWSDPGERQQRQDLVYKKQSILLCI